MTRRLSIVVPFAVLAAGLAFAEAPPDTRQENSDKQDTTRSRPRIRFGGLMVNAGYSHFSGGPFFSPFYGFPFRPWMWGPNAWNWPMMYDPFFYGPYLHPGFFTGFGRYPAMGEIKLKSGDADAWVYLDGALAGKADKLKNMWLEPGVYNLEVRSGGKRFAQKVYVLSGKTLRLTADPERAEVRP